MTPTEFEFLKTFLKTRSGLVLSNEKQYLVESRLLPLARKGGIASLSDLVIRLQKGIDRKLETDVVEAMTTNESFFFRDKTPFDNFTNTMLPALLKARGDRKRIRIWCAAASTGQEPYSLAMLLKEAAAKLAGWRIEIIGTDISNEVLDKAKSGIYSQFEVQRGLPIQMLLKYFTQNGDMWQINPEIRGMVQWRMLNLLENFSSLGEFDVIFCRNVLIYFDQPTKSDILNRLAKLMSSDGYLVLGAAETVVGLSTAFQPVPGLRGLYHRGGVSSPGAARAGVQTGSRLFAS
ncbi:chemotaxis protein methyltransferase CheR [Breoghania corrubedonensis]|uniref:Chemotaxis protein methyltransferase n=1 Tax=Breoghania corrubedonensis TaxID=665038 RepID=A0A2T5V7K7_9HYPH|nr:protein-glutamate O-methyltransferase CheR [Breoghania corrubedonensis]PTW59737.1 chemotaxis protein methyltransferase CheR [Breoghania corrubedonensis]